MTTATASETVKPVAKSQVLTFTLGEETYCVGIDYVAEIVDGGEVTALPDSDAHVEGVMNLRGETTTVINPFELIETEPETVVTDGGETTHRIIVLDTETVEADSPTCWLVSEVHEVRTISQETIGTDAIENNRFLKGLISDNDGFTLWVNPEQLLA